MGRTVHIVIFAVTVIHCYGAVQVQMPEHAEIQQPADEDLQAQVRELQRNMTDVWTYIHELRSAVSHHLKHLRLHQEALETSVHKLEHAHEAMSGYHSHDNSHGDNHHHSGEHHSHGGDNSHSGDHGSDHHSHTGEQHSHSGEHHSHAGDQHSHSGEHHSHTSGQHSHSGEHHSHTEDQHSRNEYHSHSGDQHSHSGEHHSHSDDQHSHSGEHHSHSGDQHSHSGEHQSHSGDQHSHSGEHGHDTHSESHSHSSHDHSKEDSSHSHPPEPDHKDSHETEDLQQTIQQVAVDPVAEPVVVATTRQEHYHHHHREQKPANRSSSTGTMDLMSENSFHHHHHHHSSTSRRNKTVELPKYTDYDVYYFAVCSVQPNRAIPEDQQQNVGGQVTFWQKKTGGPLNIHVRLQGFQMEGHHGHHGAHQAIQQEENNETPQEVVIHKHGFHIHAFGNISNGCQSAGPHYNPKGVNHGGPKALTRHVGDLGNIECDDNGFANLLFSDDVASLQGPYSIVGKAIVIHSNPDDLGLGGDAESLKTGNAGTRIACCVIQGLEKLPIRHYKTMKSATQYQNY